MTDRTESDIIETAAMRWWDLMACLLTEECERVIPVIDDELARVWAMLDSSQRWLVRQRVMEIWNGYCRAASLVSDVRRTEEDRPS